MSGAALADPFADDLSWRDDRAAPEALSAHPRNPKRHPPEQIAQIRASIQEFGFTRPVLVTADGVILAGAGAVAAAILERLPSIPIRRRRAERPLSEAQELALLVADNRIPENGAWDQAELVAILGELRAEDFSLDVVGFSLAEADALLAGFGMPAGQNQGGSGVPGAGGPSGPSGAGSLAERFLIAPFSVLNAREGWWQSRKAAWLALGIRSEIGRGANLIGRSPQELFCHFAGVPYAEAREIVAAAMAEQGEAFDVDALIEQHTGRRPGASDFERSGAVVPNGPGGLVAQLAADPSYYPKKRAAEADAGRALTHKEFKRDYYVSPETSTVAGSGTSIFDPVLCELAYRWFCPPEGTVLDPFAGGSVRGVVAAKLGRSYFGVELRAEQVSANIAQVNNIVGTEPARVFYRIGDARELCAEWLSKAGVEAADLLFTSPPYFDLEQYSNDPRDLSNMTWTEFLAGYGEIIRRATGLLKEDRFAVFVVGEVRDPKGAYRGLVPATIAAFEAAGLRFYNEAILVTAVGSLPIRAGRTFAAGRKLGKTHQNVLVFVKGEGARAAEACGQVDVADPLELITEGVIEASALTEEAAREFSEGAGPRGSPLDSLQLPESQP